MMRFYGLLLLFIISITKAHALNIKPFIKPWFENTNQQAARLMSEKKYADAEKTFTRPDWQAVAAYRGTNYEAAAKQFNALHSQLGFYNQGNALAHLGQYQKAIQAYEKVLQMNPKHEDAKHNRDLLKKLLDENKQDQEKQDQDQDKQDQSQDKQDQDQEKQDQDQDKQDQSQDKQDQDQDKQDQSQDKQDQGQDKQDQSQDKQDQSQDKQDQSQDKQDQAQALRLVPDDPGGLLREKFWRDHWRRLKAARS